MAHVAPGTSGEIVWTFNRAGEFDFACLIPGHYQVGMVGQVVVTPPPKGVDEMNTTEPIAASSRSPASLRWPRSRRGAGAGSGARAGEQRAGRGLEGQLRLLQGLDRPLREKPAASSHRHDKGNTAVRQRHAQVALGSCHTAVIGRYAIEGHVPARTRSRRLLQGEPDRGPPVAGHADRLPAWTGPSTAARRMPHDVLLVATDGSTRVSAATVEPGEAPMKPAPLPWHLLLACAGAARARRPTDAEVRKVDKDAGKITLKRTARSRTCRCRR